MEENFQSDEIGSLSVTNLFGRFNHSIRFPESSDILIITAPNGYGKTILLGIINSIFNRKFSFFLKLNFDEIKVEFTSGKFISITKTTKPDSDDEDSFGRSAVLVKSGDESFTISPEIRSSQVHELERDLPVDYIEYDKWHDYRTDQFLSTHELIDRYEDWLPKDFYDSSKIPEWLNNILHCVNTRLVETQRLLYIENGEISRLRRRLKAKPSSAVREHASHLANLIGELLQMYANESQKLDQTFPKRIITSPNRSLSNEKEIRENLQNLTEKRDDLVSVGLLDATDSDPIQTYDVIEEESIRKILEIYVKDTEKKLEIFDETYKKIELFKRILDERLLFKTIEINASKGFRAVDIDNKLTIPLPDLSSGEQHELVLIYELLFKVKEGSIILIDEPELSLHIAWQKKFIADLQEIQKLKKLSVVIATHSPHIIHDNWELVQELER